MSTATRNPEQEQTRQSTALRRLFTSQTQYQIVGRTRQWLIVSVALMILCVGGLLIRGLNFTLDFTGGTSFVVENATAEFEAEDLREAVGPFADGDVTAQVVDDGSGALVTMPALDEVGGESEREVRAVIAEVTGADESDIAISSVGPRWGSQVSNQALRGLLVFLLLVLAYISIRFELRMAIASVVSLLHDVLFTIGVYALVGFQISPASVIAFLTILGYSLYDTVVIFDRITEETKTLTSTSNRTYGEVANHALNEVLVRSISTTVTSILPVASLLFLGGGLLGADTLSDLALALFLGMLAGTYSSIFVATPLLVWMKERQPRWAEHKERILARRGGAQAAVAQASAGASRPAQPKPAPRSRSTKRRKRR